MTSPRQGAPRVLTDTTEETLRSASVLFDEYRTHYGQAPDDDRSTCRWLTQMVHANLLNVWMAVLDGEGGPRPVGVATSHAVPASLALGQFWLLRDLYVLPASRGSGVAATLVGAVRDAARDAGAMRLSLTTEPDNRAALALYAPLGFRPVEGVTSLNLDLRD